MPKIAYQGYQHVPAQSLDPNFEMQLYGHETMIEKSPMSDLRWENRGVTQPQRNRFLMGFSIALPVSMVLWAIILWGTKLLFF